MFKKITKREILAYLLGVLTLLIVMVVYDWQSFRLGFKEGIDNVTNYHSVHNDKG